MSVKRKTNPLPISLQGSSRFHQIVESLSDMIYELDMEGKFFYANQAMVSTLGYSRKELAEMHYWDLVKRNNRPDLIDFYTNQRKSMNQSSYYEFPLITKNGEEIWVGQNVNMIFQNEGQVIVRAVARNISRVKKLNDEIAQKASLLQTMNNKLVETSKLLEEQTNQLEMILNTMGDGVVVIDSEYNFVLFNKAAEKLFGNDALNLPIEQWPKYFGTYYTDKCDYIPPDQLPIVRALRGEEVYNYETYIQNETHPNGIHVRSNSRPLKDSDGAIAGALSVISDITEQKKYEKELLESKDKAEKASNAKGEFLSTMSHEIRTPLNAVIGMTYLLLEQGPQPHQVENLNTLRFSAENLLALINDILDYNKIEAGRITFESVDFRIKELISRLRRALSLRAEEKGLEFKAIIDEAVPDIVVGDPVRLNQVLTNLVNNAIKFTNKGKVYITATLKKETKSDVTITFQVEDTGIGIPKEKLDLIFDRFSQAEVETTRKFGGTGLGLAITKKLIELQNKDIRVKSKPNKGSTFIFELDFQKSNKKITQQNDFNNSESDKTDLSGVKILIVEDNEINQMVVYKFLNKWNAEIEIAYNGKIAVEKVKTDDYDVILMDIQMPEMDGYEASRIIKGMGGKYKNLPILALTASVSMDIREDVFRAGMDDFIPKPFDPQELYRKILRTVKNKVGNTNRKKQKALINLNKIEKISDGDPEFFQNMLVTYSKLIKEFQQNYHEAFLIKDDLAIGKAVHKMSSSLQLFEVNKLSSEIKKGKELLEDRLSKSQIQNHLSKIKSICDQIESELKTKIVNIKEPDSTATSNF